MYSSSRAGGAGPVAQAMAGPIFEAFQDFSSGHMLVQAGNMHVCRLQAKCRIMPSLIPRHQIFRARPAALLKSLQGAREKFGLRTRLDNAT